MGYDNLYDNRTDSYPLYSGQMGGGSQKGCALVSSKQTLPKKPYPSFPLTPHKNGTWCKKIRGKLHYFGPTSDPEAAYRRYLAVAEDLHAGRSPMRVGSGELTVKELGNAYLAWQKEKLDVGEIGPAWFEDCRSIVIEFAKSIGTTRSVEHLAPQDFQRHRTKLAKRLGVYALKRHINTIRGVFRYAYENRLIEAPMQMGTGFAAPSATHVRKARQASGPRLFTPEEARDIIALSQSHPVLHAAVLLGFNGGFGNTDVAQLPISAVNFDERVIKFPRPKTHVERTVPLWPETVVALRAAINARPKPATAIAESLCLLTGAGHPIVRRHIRDVDNGMIKVARTDWLWHKFSRVLKQLGIARSGLSFYAIRHTFRTMGDEVRDQHAIHRIMGHAIPGMSGIYIEDISLDRLRAVVEHVRVKLWSEQC